MPKDKTVVVSDIHAETWTDDPILHTDRTKLALFIEFLNDFVKTNAETLVINGDLFDVPDYQDPPRPILPHYANLLAALANLTTTNPPTKIYWVIGNHELGLSGLDVDDYQHFKIKFNTLNLTPDPENKPNAQICVVHGHDYDPFLSLYIYKMVTRKIYSPRALWARFKLSLFQLLNLVGLGGWVVRYLGGGDRGVPEYMSELNRTAVLAAQRRDPETGERIMPNGIFQATDASQLQVPSWLIRRFWAWVTKYYIKENWQNAAQVRFDTFCRDEPNLEIKAITMGHTHVHDECQLSYNNGAKTTIYLNSGDWMEPVPGKDLDTHDANFIVFDRDCNIVPGPQNNNVRDWITETY